MARQLAQVTGESLTKAINTALKERLEKVGAQKEAEREAFVRELLEIAKGTKGLRRLKKSSRELVEDLYDENGLPR